jgi:hypothetical protein
MSPHQTQTRLGFVCNTYGTCKNDFTLCFEVRKHVNKNNEEVVKQSTTETRCRLTVTTTTRTQRKLEAVVVMVLCAPSPEVARAMAATSLSYPFVFFPPPPCPRPLSFSLKTLRPSGLACLPTRAGWTPRVRAPPSYQLTTVPLDAPRSPYLLSHVPLTLGTSPAPYRTWRPLCGGPYAVRPKDRQTFAQFCVV